MGFQSRQNLLGNLNNQVETANEKTETSRQKIADAKEQRKDEMDDGTLRADLFEKFRILKQTNESLKGEMK